MDPRVLGARVRISDERKRDDSEPAARLARSASDVHSAELARLLATLSEGTHGREGVEVARLIEEEELDYETIKRLDLDDLEHLGVARFGDRVRALAAVRSCLALNNPDEAPSADRLSAHVGDLVNLDRLSAGSDAKLATAMLLRQRATNPPKLPLIIVPTVMTVMIKKFREAEDCDDVRMVCTIIQKVLFYDLSNISRVNERFKTPTFGFRFNEGSCDADEVVKLRKTTPLAIKCELRERGASSKREHSFPCVGSTFSGDLPMVQYSIYEEHPFRIVAAEVLVELTSFTGHDQSMDTFEFRPDLVCPLGDQRLLVAVRDWDKVERFDEMHTYSVLNTSPVVEYNIDAKPDKRRGGCVREPNVPKVRLTFYLTTNPTQPFLETVAPVIFVLICNSENNRYTINYDNFINNLATLGLTIVFIIPTLRSKGYFTNHFELNHAYMLLLFAGTSFSVLAFGHANEDKDTSNRPFVMQTIANIILWGALLIPFVNWVRYKIYCWGIAHAIPHEASADTFNGNPKLEQTVDPEELRPFYDEVPGDHGLFKPCSHNGLQVVSKHMRPRLDFWLYLRFYILGLKGADSRTLLRSRDNPLLRRSWESHTCDPVESAAPEKSVSSSDYAAMEDEARRSLGLSGVFRTSTGEDAVTV